VSEQTDAHALAEKVRRWLGPEGLGPHGCSEALAVLEARAAEADEWESRYNELLDAVGGVWPG
jgi:hypothetical protein